MRSIQDLPLLPAEREPVAPERGREHLSTEDQRDRRRGRRAAYRSEVQASEAEEGGDGPPSLSAHNSRNPHDGWGFLTVGFAPAGRIGGVGRTKIRQNL